MSVLKQCIGNDKSVIIAAYSAQHAIAPVTQCLTIDILSEGIYYILYKI